jgi:hypothetical protein
MQCKVYNANHAPKTTQMQVLNPNIRSVADPYNLLAPLAFAEPEFEPEFEPGFEPLVDPTLILPVTLAVAPPDPVGV